MSILLGCRIASCLDAHETRCRLRSVQLPKEQERARRSPISCAANLEQAGLRARAVSSPDPAFIRPR